jgi:hypothetical protein
VPCKSFCKNEITLLRQKSFRGGAARRLLPVGASMMRADMRLAVRLMIDRAGLAQTCPVKL